MERSVSTVIEEALGSACATAFPARRVVGISDVATLSGGWECDVLAFTLTSDDLGRNRRDSLVLRIYQGESGAEKASGEYRTLEALHRAEYPVPSVFYLGTTETAVGKPFIITERIVGPDLGERMKEASADERRSLVTEFCELYTRLHRLDWRPYVEDASEYAPGRDIDRFLAAAERRVQTYSAMEFQPIVNWLRDHRGDVHWRAPSVIHGDFHPWNILVRQRDSRPFVIDWTSADIADYRFDLGWTLLLVASAGMPSRDEVLHEYERLAGAPVESLEYFEVAACARRLTDIVLSLQHGPEALGMRTDAAATMSGNLRHLRTAATVLDERTGIRIGAVDAFLGPPT